jgi:hypothetical protein
MKVTITNPKYNAGADPVTGTTYHDFDVVITDWKATDGIPDASNPAVVQAVQEAARKFFAYSETGAN